MSNENKKRESGKGEISGDGEHAEHAPNIAFVGERIGRRPIEVLRDGQTEIVMPELTAQRKPFYHAEAARIARLFPLLYKIVTEKG